MYYHWETIKDTLSGTVYTKTTHLDRRFSIKSTSTIFKYHCFSFLQFHFIFWVFIVFVLYSLLPCSLKFLKIIKFNKRK